MTESYDPKAIEPKWQAQWEEDGLYRAKVDWDKPKHYALTMLPYPSGDLHIGHWFAMVPSDARARWMRMKGYNVLFPMGFDAFGLPAENAAIQRNIHPWKWTYANIERMRKQLRSMGAMFDWQREAISSTPEYYQWTQWFFREFYKANLAYRGEAMVNWSPTLQTVLANEQVIDGKDERTGQPVIQKMMTQWFFRYTRYADELLDFSHIDWPEPVRIMQENWIGRSEGARVVFHTEGGDPIEVFTTRPDTLWGATFMVLAPEHELVDVVTTDDQREKVKAYQEEAANATEIERLSTDREKTGVFTGGYAVNPVNGERIPIWIADYVLASYGTGAIMAVPAHDERDFAFARKYDLTITPVIQPEGEDFDGETMEEAYVGPGQMINSDHFNGTEVTEGKGRKNPGISAVIDWLEEEDIGCEAINYRLRDWLISRQRYWGSPIPVIYRQDGTLETVPDEGLPVELPEDVEFMPSGRSPLTYHEPFLNTTDSDGNAARRETDTMDTFMCSSWYHYRYLSPHYEGGPFDPEEAAYWLPVDVYTGGAEHATMHLLYTRWFAKAMRDLGMFDETIAIMEEHGRDPEEILWGEPMLLLRNQGQVLGAERPGDFVLASGEMRDGKLFADYVQVIERHEAPDTFDGVMGEVMRRTENIMHVAHGDEVAIVEVVEGAHIEIPRIEEGEARHDQIRHHLEIQRMSKSKGNVVNPDELVEQYGTDTVRAYLMFAFDWQKGGPWDPEGIKGPVRFLHEVWDMITAPKPEVDGEANEKDVRALRRKVHQMITRITDGLENFAFNTSIAGLMELKNAMREAYKTPVVNTEAWDEAVQTIVTMMAPFTPHIAEELWYRLGHTESVHIQPWPEADPEAAKEDVLTLAVQINGKVRDRVEVPADTSADDAKAAALEAERIQEMLAGKEPKKVIYVPGRLVNIVV